MSTLAHEMPGMPGVQLVQLSGGECVAYELLADESHPHRVRFWRVSIDTEQLTLQPAHEQGEPKRLDATWHELYDLLEVRPQLLDEIEELRAELAELERQCTRLRTHWQRLKRIVNARQVDVGDARVLSLADVVQRRRST